MGHVRVSTVEQMDEGVSLAQQRAAIELYALANGLVLVAVVEDGGVTEIGIVITGIGCGILPYTQFLHDSGPGPRVL